jgi:hypothetical protein
MRAEEGDESVEELAGDAKQSQKKIDKVIDEDYDVEKADPKAK